MDGSRSPRLATVPRETKDVHADNVSTVPPSAAMPAGRMHANDDRTIRDFIPARRSESPASTTRFAKRGGQVKKVSFKNDVERKVFNVEDHGTREAWEITGNPKQREWDRYLPGSTSQAIAWK